MIAIRIIENCNKFIYLDALPILCMYTYFIPTYKFRYHSMATTVIHCYKLYYIEILSIIFV